MARYTTDMIVKYNNALDALDNFSDSDLDNAPTLSNYIIVETPSGRIVMFGDVENHPRLGSMSIYTSDLVWVDTNVGAARTRSRWYRLGTRDTVAAGDLVIAGWMRGYVISDSKIQKMLADKAQEFRQLMISRKIFTEN